ncbi:hypothetical protein jhhlp_005257 [Lomentospora prolificans]|uniref:Uncharacterized protein n=1 Tax=Lomentospora prolificans TaxID=41688 RepID=A0A2N3N793_9PEZI|nr:hypothetical protein jhhlp_005257 [Lomentospora prolificans]
MSSFGGKRKARVIKVDDVDEPEPGSETTPQEAGSSRESCPTSPHPQHRADEIQFAKADDNVSSPAAQTPVFSKVARKPFRQSGLRKSINVAEADTADDGEPTKSTTTEPTTVKTRVDDDDDDDTGNVVIRGSLSRANSTKQKKRKSASRLSFGIRADEDEDDHPSGVRTPEMLTPKRKGDVGLKKAIALKDLAMRSRGEEDRPRYDKDYLQELQSSTLNTPKDTSRSSATEDEDIHMDLSELEGAVIVNSAELMDSGTVDESSSARILTDAEIREKKERRARLRQEAAADFISLEDDDPFTSKKDEESTRLVREDENLYEGFEEFVDDGGVALGRKAEREARRLKRSQIASLIQEAEGNSDEESDDSDAERRVAFEASQSRAGMDGLRRPTQNPAEVPKPKITPLPTMSECLTALQSSLQLMERELAAKSKQVTDLRMEKEEIRKREVEVQRLLDEAGEKYRTVVAGAEKATDSPARQILPAETTSEFAAERGLESFGTPVTKNGGTDEHRATP